MRVGSADLAGKRRQLQLETLYDLLVVLHSHRTEQELVDELLERVCAVLDPSAALAVTRDPFGAARSVANVGWLDQAPTAEGLLSDPLWHELLARGRAVARREGVLAGRPYRQLLAAPFGYRGVFFGYLALLDKEGRGGESLEFSDEDLRFLGAVVAIAGVTLDGLRQMESLVTRSERLAEENKALKEKLEHEVSGQRIVAQAPAMRRIIDIVERVAPRGVNVLVRGESGTGKELVARLLHVLAARPGPMIAINCAALPESLLESELFGIEGGVATGVHARAGKIELADGGTLFLDEIGDLQVALQVKLLRVLQEREIVRVGGHKSTPVDVRLVTATHRSLEDLIEQNRFREDLYYRLKGVEVELPPLRDRRQDIPHLVRYFAERFCERERIPVPNFTSEALTFLLAYDFPGNVRELQNLVEGAVSLAEGSVEAGLVHSLVGGGTQQGPEPLDLQTMERRHIQRVLRLTSGNKTAAAKILGLDRRTLVRKGF